MKLVGLTGSIGMGKSTAALLLRRRGIAVHDADAAVHRLLAPRGAAVAAVLARFPGTGDGQGGIDRKALGAAVFGAPAELRALEAILHPRVRHATLAQLARWRAQRRALAVLDIPLLYETQAQRRFALDAVIVVSAPAFLQRQRVLRRPGMTVQRLEAVLKLQVPDAEKRARADAVVPSGLGLAAMDRALGVALHRIAARP